MMPQEIYGNAEGRLNRFSSRDVDKAARQDAEGALCHCGTLCRMSLGVHFAIDAETAGRLLAAADDHQVAALIEEIEEEAIDVDHCDTDKAWDAIHRSLTDGYLGYSNGTYPLNAVILGGTQLYEGDDYIVSLLTPAQVRDVANAAAGVDQVTLKEGYDRIDIQDYGPEFGDEDFAYTWSNYEDLATFFQRAAEAGDHVIFTVSQ
jgi:hypothetical protein